MRDDLDYLILHKWGHFIDCRRLDDGERLEYMRMRGIPEDLEWKGYETSSATPDALSYMRSPAEDFAEVFAPVMGKSSGSIRLPSARWRTSPPSLTG